jgi:hypothetical protein
MEGTINFIPAGRTILLYPETEKYGLDLSMIKDYPIDLPVVAVGDECTKVKVGDRVVCNGTCLTLFVDGKKYLQMFESQVMGFVVNGAKVSTEPGLPSTAQA